MEEGGGERKDKDRTQKSTDRDLGQRQETSPSVKLQQLREVENHVHCQSWLTKEGGQ